MGLFFSKKRKEQEALLMATEEYVFRIEDITYLKNNLVSLGGRMLKGTICVGDKFIFNGVAYEIAGLMRGIEPNTEIAQNLYCGLVIHYKTTGIYKTIFKLGAVKIVKSSCLEKDNQAYEDCTLPTQSKTYICARCKKEITDDESKWIGNHRFCADCAAPPQKATMESHLEAEAREAGYQAYMDFARGSLTPEQAYSNRGFVKDKDGKWVYGKLMTKNTFICSKCGKELAKKYMHANHVCVDCATLPVNKTPQKQKGHSSYENSLKVDAIRVLRKSIIKVINKTPATTYELASLLWSEAAKCFPTTYSFSWDGAWFKLDLITRKLYADVSTYPNQFGATRDERYNLTAAEFHKKAIEFNMTEELRCMETDADWQELFDKDLQAAIENVQKILKVQQEKQEQAQRISNAIVIPDKFSVISPTMELEEILLELRQKYGSSSIWLIKESEKYVLKYWYSATYSSDSKKSERELSLMESAWVEQQVNDCIMNQDKTTWQSMPGGDMMTVKIRTENKPQIEFRNEVPLKKYYELQLLLEKLANYGSFSETEMKRIKK